MKIWAIVALCLLAIVSLHQIFSNKDDAGAWTRWAQIIVTSALQFPLWWIVLRA